MVRVKEYRHQMIIAETGRIFTGFEVRKPRGSSSATSGCMSLLT